MTSKSYDNPPSYDSVTEGNDVANSYQNKDAKQPPKALSMQPQQPLAAGPSSYAVHNAPGHGPSPVVYHYRNPVTQETVASLLPPDHPEMICLQAGEHISHTHFGVLGILAAVFWFPLGVGLCLLDRKVKCRRCGKVIDDGFCG